jgi:prophage antirepressor-like protein
MSDLVPFPFQQYIVHGLVNDEGMPAVLARDVRQVFGYARARDMMRRVAPAHKFKTRFLSAGFANEEWCLLEQGVIDIARRANKSRAKEFMGYFVDVMVPRLRPQRQGFKSHDEMVPQTSKALIHNAFQVLDMHESRLDKHEEWIVDNHTLAKDVGNRLEEVIEINAEQFAEVKDAVSQARTELNGKVSSIEEYLDYLTIEQWLERHTMQHMLSDFAKRQLALHLIEVCRLNGRRVFKADVVGHINERHNRYPIDILDTCIPSWMEQTSAQLWMSRRGETV